MVGIALSKEVPNAIKTTCTHRPNPQAFQVYADLLVYDTLFNIFKDYRPDIVYLSASNANVEACEDKETDAVNIRGSITVLRLCEMFNCKLVFISSSYVFDGEQEWPYTPDQKTNPINHYGVQKDTVEKAILKSDGQFVIVRTVGVFGREMRKKNFVNQILKTVVSGNKINVPADQWMNPIASDDLAKIIVQLARKHNGVFHVAGDTCMTKYDFAKKIVSQYDADEFIVSKSGDEVKQRAERPLMGCLDCHELENLGIMIPSFDRGLRKFLDMEFHQ